MRAHKPDRQQILSKLRNNAPSAGGHTRASGQSGNHADDAVGLEEIRHSGPSSSTTTTLDKHR